MKLKRLSGCSIFNTIDLFTICSEIGVVAEYVMCNVYDDDEETHINY